MRTLAAAGLLVGALALGGCKTAPPVANAAAAQAMADSPAWIAGSWRMASDGTVTEEHWLPNAGGVMLGIGRTMQDGRTVFFEYLRIERRGGDWAYVAQPKGNPPTVFTATSVSPGEIVFENPQHDYPTKITYRRISGESMVARIEGPGGERPQEFRFVRCDAKLTP